MYYTELVASVWLSNSQSSVLVPPLLLGQRKTQSSKVHSSHFPPAIHPHGCMEKIYLPSHHTPLSAPVINAKSAGSSV
jgi:hypothetical protein